MNETINIDAYPLTPMQKGMLFHTVSAPKSDVYVEQLSCSLIGPLEAELFKEAWGQVIMRHAALRTAFAWQGLEEPLQVVAPRSKVPLEVLDWLGEDNQSDRLSELCLVERKQGFKLTAPPLMRIKLVQLKHEEFQLIWTWHHSILDAWSVPIVIEEVFALYDAAVTGASAHLPAKHDFKEFIAWQLNQDKAKPQIFWKSYLSGFEEPTKIGIDAGPPKVGSGEYGLEFFPIAPAEIDLLRAGARKSGVTLNTLVQGAWAFLLARYSGQKDVVFGTAVAGRPAELPGVEAMVGLFINTLPVRCKMEATQVATDWLQDHQRQSVQARAHEHIALADIHGWSDVSKEREMFESLLVFEDFPSHRSDLTGGGVSVGDVDFVERANLPLTVLFAVRKDSVIGVGYDADRFDSAAIGRMVVHLKTLLLNLADDPTQPLSSFDHFKSDERQKIIQQWSAAPNPISAACQLADLSVSRLFEAQVELSPTNTALIFNGPQGDETLDYATLNKRANTLANYLISKGISSVDRVAIAMDASLWRIISVLAVIKCGAAYVPLDPDFPSGLLAELTDDCAPKLILTEPNTIADLTEIDPSLILSLNDAHTMISGENSANLEYTPKPKNVAYLNYTSGSTGKRKGVCVNHRSLRHLVEGQLDAFGITANSRVLQFASFSFDASVSEIFTALLSGACLYMAPRRTLLPSQEMMDLLHRWEIDTLTLAPSVLAKLPNAILPHLKTLIAAGEACPAELAERWSVPERKFLNAYGPCEATVCATVGTISASGEKPTIGYPMWQTRIYILDDDLRPVPQGVSGEIYIGGPGVSDGYWQRPELNAASFLFNPFSRDLGESKRMYRSGDQGRFHENGEIEYLGRRDEQLKIRGMRVEIGEIEASMSDVETVKSAAVVAIESNGQSKDLVGFAVRQTVEGTSKFEWWPSIAEFFVYDDMAYHAMTYDERRNESYIAAIQKKVPGRIVLEVGAGPEALLSRFCVDAGAKHVYAIELLEDTYNKAKAKIAELGLQDKITLIHGDATKVTLPEQAEVCVSEIVGAIGGSEGAAVITNQIRHNLKTDAAMIPAKSLTLYAPVQLPDALLKQQGFSPLGARYVDKIFADVGHPFDLRLCARGLDRSCLLAEPKPFEDFDYHSELKPEYQFDTEFALTKSGRCDGFLVWLTLDTGGGEVIDILDHEHCWLPVFFPLKDDGVAVQIGERLTAQCGATLMDDDLHSDYFIAAQLERDGKPVISNRYDAFHQSNIFGATKFHRGFFESEKPRVLQKQDTAIIDGLRARNQATLPAYMVPKRLFMLDELPLTSSGKLDRKALEALAHQLVTEKAAEQTSAPVSSVEATIAKIWQEVLKVEYVSTGMNFFEHGGHSLLLLDVQTRLVGADLGRIEVVDLFKYPTVRTLAAYLSSKTDDATSKAEGVDRAAARQKARAVKKRHDPK
ncbi:MAG: amino acid adenylation domain-containing protein [Candidatus Azotimanducaceae bacterium]|jgi:amino acid adenylation domain-containing protein